MFYQMSKRKYTQGKRAEQQEQTRRRIVEATMQLHETLGAARTTISAVAQAAGVQRLTVYRHFADDGELLRACTSTWLERNPLPDPEVWDTAEDPIRAAFEAFFGYYRRTRRMWASSYRDVDLVPALEEPMEAVEQFLDTLAEDLVDTLEPKGGPRRKDAFVVVRLGLRFSTWESMTEAGASDPEAAALLRRWLDCIAAGPGILAG